MPKVAIDLMHRETAGNDPLYSRTTREYYAATQRRHPKFPLIKTDAVGVALVRLPESFDDYFMMIEASARRNFKKAERRGYTFEKIEYNDFLGDIREIWQSTDVRQGNVPEYMLRGEVTPSDNPATTTSVHDYPYFGILRDRKLLAYAGCLVSGELCAIEQIFGHARYQSDGVVPMLIISIAGHIMKNFPKVKCYTYDTFLGATTNMKRFKRKFGFLPHRVKWRLG